MLSRFLRIRRLPSIVASFPRVKSNSSSPFSIVPIGQLQPTQQSPYEPGQLILHRFFGYRGVVLHSWKANLYEMTGFTPKIHPLDESSEETDSPFKTPVKREKPVYVYAVLFDVRDATLSGFSMIVGVPFLPYGEGRVENTYSATDMDYAFHEDLLPYTCTNELPLINSSFMEFMHFDPDAEPKVYPTDRLEQVLKKFGPLLEVQSVHQGTTDGIRVTAIPFFLGRRKWRFLILIEDTTHRGIKLCGVYWNFSTADGRPLNEFDAEFVETPLLPAQSPYFQFHGCFQVPTPNVRACGFFRLEDTDGIALAVDIPLLPFLDVGYYRELYQSETGSNDEIE
ncbi:polymerase delta-interacting protein 2 [Taenia crassiceps]|uniref:Polymerase delta-interacting protein 2 n=1 Tax=Taenia crassiceps TaxID=6207 RepID=A0ABR4QGI7_9CEST